jgi:hypothetical protein
MKKVLFAALVAVSGSAFAEPGFMKPGLWEIKIIHQEMDGKDMTGQMADAQAKMQQRLAAMPPDQRAKMEAILGAQAPSGTQRVCMSEAMAARGKAMIDREGHCDPSKFDRSGNKISFEFNCTTNGRTRIGKGETIAEGDTVTTRFEATTTDAKGSHSMKNESQMKYLGTDCQGMKPADQFAK